MISFDLLSPPYLATNVAVPVHNYLKRKYGANGLKLESEFSKKVNWKPTIQIKSSSSELVLVEVAEAPYPAIFHTTYPSLIHDEANRAIKVFQACTLDSFQDKKYAKAIRELKAHGFGLLTVDDGGVVDEQFAASVLIHHISDIKFQEAIKSFHPDVKAAFVNAFDVYRTNSKQGLQHAGQIIEALVHLIAEQSKHQAWLSSYSQSSNASTVIDNLYNATDSKLKEQRACFGGARQFIKLDRNSSSHPAKSRQQAQATALSTKGGFELALRVAGELCSARKTLQLKKKLSL